MVMTALVPVGASATDQGHPTRAGESLRITTARAVSYGSPYFDVDGVPEDFAFRARMRVNTEVRCDEGRRAVVVFGPVTAHQGPQAGPFTCTGSPQNVTIIPAAGQEGPVTVTAQLRYDEDGDRGVVASHARTVTATDVRTSWARLTAPEAVVRNRAMQLSSTIQLFTHGSWRPLSTRVVVETRSGGPWKPVGEVITGRNGRLRYTTPPVTRAGEWRLSWNHGGHRWSSSTAEVEVEEPVVLPSAPGFWAGKVTRTTADMHWSRPRSGSDITGYRFGWTSSNGKPVRSWQDDWPANAPNPLTMINLHPGTTYRMWIAAITPDGIGRRAAVTVTTRKAVSAPTAPRSVKAQPGVRRVALRWSAPARTGGAAVKGYQVRAVAGRTRVLATVPSWRRSHVVRPLAKGKRYTLQVRARNAAGWGPWSKAVAARPR